MNAYLIAAKANAWEVDQHVGRAIDASQPEYELEAKGVGAGRREDESTMRRVHWLKGLFAAA